MWMMGYCDGGDSFSGRKLRTLMPRPAAPTPLNNPPCLGRIHTGADHLLSFNHHLATATEQQSKRDLNAQQQVVVSSRWNPTPEQLQTLEELYRRGTRTPSAEQIQQITAQLRRYGKIEGKNVFYWFQNHKARERQKRRRQLESTSDDQQQQQPHTTMENTERKESGANIGTGLLEAERTKNWPSPTNCSSTLPPEKTTVSMQRAVKATIPECRAEGWVQFDDAELQQRKSLEERNATWQMMEIFGSSSPMNTCSSFSSAAAPTLRRKSNKQLKPHNLNFFLTPAYHDQEEDNLIFLDDHDRSSGNCDSQTLQLFPLQSSQEIHPENVGEKLEADISVSDQMNTTTTTPPHKFFEFLPLKN